ncbi:uncharacterized protein LOC143988771 isoform X8 [Lithobates pipiens]
MTDYSSKKEMQMKLFEANHSSKKEMQMKLFEANHSSKKETQIKLFEANHSSKKEMQMKLFEAVPSGGSRDSRRGTPEEQVRGHSVQNELHSGVLWRV